MKTNENLVFFSIGFTGALGKKHVLMESDAAGGQAGQAEKSLPEKNNPVSWLCFSFLVFFFFFYIGILCFFFFNGFTWLFCDFTWFLCGFTWF